jgi:drug/metabolite transporter (DMT)-like permease
MISLDAKVLSLRGGFSFHKPSNVLMRQRKQAAGSFENACTGKISEDLLPPNEFMVISFSIVVYIFCSSCMPIINKAALKSLPRPFAVSALQTASAAVLLMCFRNTGLIEFPSPTSAKLWGWSGVVAAWIVPIVLNMKAIQLLTVETVMMFRSLAIVIVAVGDVVLLKTKISARSIVSCIMISLGGVIYASNDLNFHFWGYIMGGLYAISMVVNSLYIKYCFNQHQEMNSWEKTFLNNFVSTPVVIAMCGISEDTKNLFRDFHALSIKEHLLLALSGIMGFGISMSGTKCREYLSATSFDVLGSCTKYLTLALSLAILRARNSILSIIGICIALSGTVLYSPAGEVIINSLCLCKGQQPPDANKLSKKQANAFGSKRRT